LFFRYKEIFTPQFGVVLLPPVQAYMTAALGNAIYAALDDYFKMI
jgi:hypothetical protein